MVLSAPRSPLLRHAGGVTAMPGEKFVVTDKYSGEVLRELHFDTVEEIREKIRRTHELLPVMRSKSKEELIDFLKAMSRAFRRKKAKLRETMVREGGLPYKYADWACNTISRGFLTADYYLETLSDEYPETESGIGHLNWEPVGLVAGITPRNSPMMLPMFIATHSWVARNQVILKPSTSVPLTTLIIQEMLRDVTDEIPLEVVLAGGKAAATEFLYNPMVDALVLYGSSPVGKDLFVTFGQYLESTKRPLAGGFWIDGRLKKIVLELAGNDPGIIMGDFPVDTAVDYMTRAAFYNSGQMCISTKRILVHEDIADEFIEGLTDRVSKLKVGNPMDPDTDIGPIGSKRILDIVEMMIMDAQQRGGKVILGGKREDPFLYPTLVEFDKKDILGRPYEETPFLWREEAFGPLRSIVRFSTKEEAIALANNSKYGLRASVFSADVEVAKEIAYSIQTSSVLVNQDPMELDLSYAWGGIKDSGIGGAEYLCRTLSNRRYVYVRTDEPK